MNYRLVYIKIIAKAKFEESEGKRNYGYYEKHHILPKSLYPLWCCRESNLVKLTAREHLFVHMLLTKIYPKSHEMWSALWYMSCKSKKEKSNYPKLSLREYERIKVGYVKSNSEYLKGNKNTKGKVWWTKDGKSLMAVDCPGEGWVRGRNTKGKETWNKGKPMTEEQKRKLSESTKGKKPWNTGLKGKGVCVAWNKGIEMSEDFKEKCKLREARKREK